MLVYATEALKQHLEETKMAFEDLDSSINHKELRKLDDRVEEDYRLLVATKPEVMRGLDFRAPHNGIHLLVCKSFCH